MKTINIFPAIAALVIIMLCSGCDPQPPKPENPVFTDVQKITVSNTGGIFIFSEVPEYVKYMQLLIFSTTPAVNDDNKTIDKSSLVAGSRTGLAGFSRASASIYYLYDDTDDDFTGGSYTVNTAHYIVVLGFDSDLNLTHASPAYQIADID